MIYGINIYQQVIFVDNEKDSETLFGLSKFGLQL